VIRMVDLLPMIAMGIVTVGLFYWVGLAALVTGSIVSDTDPDSTLDALGTVLDTFPAAAALTLVVMLFPSVHRKVVTKLAEK